MRKGGLYKNLLRTIKTLLAWQRHDFVGVVDSTRLREA